MRILILSDSLGLPRDFKGEKVLYEETYIYLLKKRFPNSDIIHVGIGGATMADIKKQSLYYPAMSPDFVFIQCGIVDCAPRAFTKFESKVIRKLRLKKVFNPFVIFLRKYRRHTYTSKRKFKKYILDINKNFKKTTNQIYYLGILPGSDEYEVLLPKITNQINIYNNILEKEGLWYVDNSDFPLDGILSDHHHLNAYGNIIIFNKILNIIEKK